MINIISYLAFLELVRGVGGLLSAVMDPIDIPPDWLQNTSSIRTLEEGALTLIHSSLFVTSISCK